MINDSYKEFIEYAKPIGIYRMDEFQTVKSGIGLKHDVDNRLDIALEMAKYEYSQGVKSTYFILHTADYYPNFPVFKEIQDMGHEIGFHNDLLTHWLKTGENPKDCLKNELRKFRENGIEIKGTFSHGSYLARDVRFLNHYSWQQTRIFQTHPQYENIRYNGKLYNIKKLDLYEFFEYDNVYY